MCVFYFYLALGGQAYEGHACEGQRTPAGLCEKDPTSEKVET